MASQLIASLRGFGRRARSDPPRLSSVSPKMALGVSLKIRMALAQPTPLAPNPTPMGAAKAARRNLAGIGISLAAVLNGKGGARLWDALQPEPEDACLTGGMRSLSRRVLGLNVTAPAAQPASPWQPSTLQAATVQAATMQAATVQADLRKPGLVAQPASPATARAPRRLRSRPVLPPFSLLA